MDKKEEMKKELVEQQVRKIQEYIEHFDEQLNTIRNTISNLKEFSKLEKGDNIISPIANGIFVKSKLEDNETIKINVGNNTIVNKKVSEAVKMLEGQEREIIKYRGEAITKINELVENV